MWWFLEYLWIWENCWLEQKCCTEWNKWLSEDDRSGEFSRKGRILHSIWSISCCYYICNRKTGLMKNKIITRFPYLEKDFCFNAHQFKRAFFSLHCNSFFMSQPFWIKDVSIRPKTKEPPPPPPNSPVDFVLIKRLKGIPDLATTFFVLNKSIFHC